MADEQGKAVTSIEAIKEEAVLTIHVTDGEMKAKVFEKKGITRV